MTAMSFPIATQDGDFVAPSPPNGPRTPGIPEREQSKDQLRVMVAGESGLGKTTFLNNIFRHLNGGENPMEQASVVRGQTRGFFGQSKTLKIEERKFDYTSPDGQQHYKFFLVDTPGYGDHVNVRKSFQPVVDFITRGNRRFLEEIRKGNQFPEPDDRTDVCIYFIAAHRCKPIDIEYMKQLSKAVAVIPVIGKSDSMTTAEMTVFKKEIADSAAQANGLEYFNFSDRAWEKCMDALEIEGDPTWLGARRPPPYAVISSQVDDPNGNDETPDPARIYPWGDCHVMRPTHSDNTYLQCLLLEVGFQDMKDEMKKRFEVFKTEEAKPLLEKIQKKNLEYRRTVSAGKTSILVVALTVICAFLAGILANPQGYWINIFPHPKGAEPRTDLDDWSDVILEIQRIEGSELILAAADSGKEQMDVLRDVLMEYYKSNAEAPEDEKNEV